MYWTGGVLFFLWLIVLVAKRGFSHVAKNFPRHHHWLRMTTEAFELPLRILVLIAALLIGVQIAKETSWLDLGMHVFIVLGVVWALFRLRSAIAHHLRQTAALPTYFLARFSYFFAIAILLAGALLLIHHFGISLSNLFLLSGGVGILLGMALRKNFTGLFAGMMAQLQGLFSPGERILIPSLNIEGDVEKIGWGRLTLRSSDKRPIYLSNRHLAGAIVINASKRSHRVLEQMLYVRHRDLPYVSVIVDEIRALLMAQPSVDKEEELLVAFDSFSKHGLEIMVQAYFFYFDEMEYRTICAKLLGEMQRIIECHDAMMVLPQQRMVMAKSLKYGGVR